jgi:hypothetical protein
MFSAVHESGYTGRTKRVRRWSSARAFFCSKRWLHDLNAKSCAGLVLWSVLHMQVHQIGRRHHVVVQIGHDPERPDDDQEHDEDAERQR